MNPDKKIKEIPEILRDLLYDTVLPRNEYSDDFYAYSYLKDIDWKQASVKERLVYAQLMYPKGTKIKSTIFGRIDTVTDMHISQINEGDIDGVISEGIEVIIYDSDLDRWAEIIEDEGNKEKISFPHHDFESQINNPLQTPTKIIEGNSDWRNPTRAEIEELLDSTQLDESEIKAGDMVEGTNVYSLNNKTWFGPFYFTGGKLITGEFVCENTSQTDDVDVRYFKRVRKHNPNRDLENIVEQFMTEKHIPKGTNRMIYNGYKLKKLLVDFGLYTINQTK